MMIYTSVWLGGVIRKVMVELFTFSTQLPLSYVVLLYIGDKNDVDDCFNNIAHIY